ncbi:La domain fused to two RRMs [Cryptosporidium sp. chipmunk genotype I]|uniref:La domain fused to two RRMs n=1 Tax=Cryptosporidium sp. chipmunk genotype I TaxID=1280935 RepID=UPI00351A0A74|nr:La domain fused to two RRMs [Cryptosporidium sp. chipmunk genotype I]
MTEIKKIHSRSPSPIVGSCEPKRIKVDSLVIGEETRCLLIKQLEYYFSDENLKTDSFFQNTMRSDPKNRLLVSYLLNCSKVKNLGITKEEEIIDVLKGHEMIFVEFNQDGKAMIKLNKNLPNLEPKKKTKEKNSVIGKDLHAGGCILKIINLPETVSWSCVKDSIKEKLNELQPESQNLIRYVSQTTQDGTCFVLLKPFKNDQLLVKGMELTFREENIPVSLVNQDEARKIIHSVFPKHIQKEREKELNKQKMAFITMPIIVGGQTFASIEHLRRCIKEVLEQSEVNTVFEKDSLTYKVLFSILEYHPRREEKIKGIKSICIKNHENSLGKDLCSKCFYIVRKSPDGIEEFEDFSINKCLQQLSRSPPLSSKLDEALNRSGTFEC